MHPSSTYLRRAAVGYLIAGLGFLAFGFPFWFLNAIDTSPKGQFTPPFFFVVDDPVAALANNWIQLVSAIGLAAGAYSLWQAGDPTGFGKKQSLLFVPMAGGISYILATWVILPFAPLGAFLNGLGMILVGIASLKANVWTGWKRYVPLSVGLFPFVFMFPFVILTGARPAAMIGFWGVAWIALGLAAWQRAQESSTVQLV
ncbi:hypothetical protein [Spirosoma spitsbergense]|uniref:hypothetical protein n=1 Tax=Spirosoma spitsbergense TaxID=431554 RepID=UPI00037D5CC1|nr:hypothetical protein [Spirosoma spitsbergense]